MSRGAAHHRARALAALGCVCALLAGCTEDPPDEAPEATPTPTAEPTAEPTDEPTGQPTDDEPDGPEAELREELHRITEQVSALRGLEILEEVDVEVLSASELRELITERNREAEAIERIAGASRVLAALRHIEPDADLAEIVEELQSSAVVGLYDPQDRVAYVSGDELPLGPAASATAAHELQHALQDQHFDLTRLEDIPEGDGDAALAFLSTVEGDAVIVEEDWAATHQDPDDRATAEEEQLEGARSQLEVLDSTPSYVVETFVFPYVAGERFVAALVEHGGYAAVDEALEDPPTTTLEVLDPQAYLDGVDFDDVVVGDPPEGDFEEVFRSTFGAFDLLALFGAADSPPAQQGSEAWTGWRGGSIAAWESGEDFVVGAAWRFDDIERADAVCAAVPEWYRDVAGGTGQGGVLESDRDTLVVRCEGTAVRFALGPDADLAGSVLAGS